MARRLSSPGDLDEGACESDEVGKEARLRCEVGIEYSRLGLIWMECAEGTGSVNADARY